MTNQSGYEPLNLENGSSVNSDKFNDSNPLAKRNGKKMHEEM